MSMSVSRALRGVALPVAVVWGFAASAQDALTVVDGYLAAWNAHDSAAAAEFFADGVVYYDASVGTPVEGRDAAKTQVIDAFLNAAPDAAADAGPATEAAEAATGAFSSRLDSSAAPPRWLPK